MKVHPYRFLKYCTTLLVLLVTNCERESAETPQEGFHEDRVKRISLSELQSRIGNSSDYSKLSALFDVHKTKPNPFQKLDASDDPYLVTDEIIMIENDDTTFYTFKIESNASETSFYNLVVAVDETDTAQSARILEYTPSADWLNDTTLPYNGEVKLHENDLFSLEELNLTTSTTAYGMCVTGVRLIWSCGAGNDHEPGHPNCTPANNAVTQVVGIYIEYGPCGVGGGGGGGGGQTVGEGNDPIGPGGGDSSGTTGTDGEDGETVNEEECMQDDNGNCIVDETVPMPPKEDPCPEGYIKDKDGNCVEQPCPGDPVPKPEITNSGKSGKKGGTFGCTREGDTDCPPPKDKHHDGLDINADKNSNVFSMYSGTVTAVRDNLEPNEYKKDSYGNYVTITSLVNGQTVNIKYNHLNNIYVSEGDSIAQGDIFGLSGVTGNAAKNPNNPKSTESTPHVHIQVYNSNYSESLNPENYLTTKFDSNQNPIPNNCN